MGISLGGILLDGFEVSAQVVFGGKQALAVHRLPGGVRVVDAMGPDEDTIRWQGVLSGSDATDRARLVDGLRVAGTSVLLAWDVFSATVIVSHVRLDFRNSWWIPYQIECTVVVGDQPANATIIPAGGIASIVDDLGGVSPVYLTGVLLTLAGADGATLVGSQANATFGSALAAARIAVGNGITAAEPALVASDLTTIVRAAGVLASYTDAAGYIGRAITNFMAL